MCMSNPTLREYFSTHPSDRECIGEKTDVDLSLTTGSKKNIMWYCPQYDCYYEQSIQSKFRKGTHSCPVCTGRTLVEGANDLATLFPELSAEWDDENDKSPHDVTQKSRYKALWKCSLCGKKWKAHVHNRVTSTYTSGCNACNAKRRNGKASGDIDIPESVAKYHVDEPGNEITSLSSRKNILWRCTDAAQTHQWLESPKTMMQHQSCPLCSGGTLYKGVVYRGRTSLRKFMYERGIPEDHTDLCPYIDTSLISYQSSSHVTRICDNNHITSRPAYTLTQSGFLHDCPMCSPGQSQGEKELYDFVSSVFPGHVISGDRTLLNGKELDIYVPDKHIAIEYNGLYWHSSTDDTDHNKNRHYDKWKACQDKGVQLLTIWEDEWRDKRAIVKSMVKNKLGVSDSRSIFARNCNVVDLTVDQARDFCDKYHIQGFVPGRFYIGLKEKGTQELVSVSVLKLETLHGERVLYISRFCTSANVPGGAGKLLAASISIGRKHHCISIVTIADHCVSDGSLYRTLGFVNDGEIRHDYKYVVAGQRKHKFNYRKKRFASDDSLQFDKDMTETQLSQLNNIPRIYDCGKSRYALPITPLSE